MFNNNYSKYRKISFKKVLYDRDEEEKAIYYLTSQYIYEHPKCSPWSAQDKAKELYQKYDPYNLVMTIEEVKSNDEI